MERKKKKLFQNCSAWFSSSVPEKKIKLWRVYGGTLETVEHAQYVFSEDKDAEDTASIFKSEAYMDEHLAVFSSRYIIDCVKKGNISSVPIGKYHLVPKHIDNDVGVIMSNLDYEIIEMSSDEEDLPQNRTRRSGSHKKKNTPKPQLSEKRSPKKSPSNLSSDYVHIKDLPKVTGMLEDVVPGEDGWTVILQ